MALARTPSPPSLPVALAVAGAGVLIYLAPLAALLRAAGPGWTALAALPWTWVWVPVGQLALHPLLWRAGVYRYFSPVLFALAPSAERLELHAGTAWDTLRLRRRPGRRGPLARALALGLLDGLEGVAAAVERGEYPPSVTVTATSHLFGRTPERLGFRAEPPALPERLNLWFNALDLAWRLSLVRGRPAWPPLHRARRIAATGADLLAHREKILRLRQRMTRGRHVAA